jgi:phospholipid-translocating ATPase
MISREANIIVVRASMHGRTVYEQMVRAVTDFFPESRILDDSGAVVAAELNVDGEREREREREREEKEREKEKERASEKGRAKEEEGEVYALQRFETDLSSIVGSQNGDRPGGFVLVIDGVALEHVCAFCVNGLLA